MKKNNATVDQFCFVSGRILARKYEVIELLGAGWEGEVYLVREVNTGIEHAAKFFFPQRNQNNRNLVQYARKLHKLRHCPIIIQYHAQDTIIFQGQPISFLVSDYVEGQILSDFLLAQPGKRLDAFQGLHLLHSLATGIENIHHMGEYHGDLHTDNIIVKRQGIGFDVKLLDFYDWKMSKRSIIKDDVVDLVRIFYDAIGGQKFYAKQPIVAKSIICGLKKNLILNKFQTAGQLREHLETMSWE